MLCSFSNTLNSNAFVLYMPITNQSWDQIRFFFEGKFNFSPMTPQGLIFKSTDLTDSFTVLSSMSIKTCQYFLQQKSVFNKVKDVKAKNK